MPLLLPWLGVLLLLLLPANRTGQAWWIWLPLACILAAETAAQSWLTFIPSQPRDLLCEATAALSFGIAALWLLARHLADRARLVSVVGMFLVVGMVSVAVYVVSQDWESWPLTLGLGVFLMAGAMVLILALNLAGWTSGRPYRPVRLGVWLAGWLVGLWTLLAAPFLAVFLFAGGGEVPWLQVLAFLWSAAGVSFATLLPFLVLAALNPFFRERLRELLHLHDLVQPPLAHADRPPQVTHGQQSVGE